VTTAVQLMANVLYDGGAMYAVPMVPSGEHAFANAYVTGTGVTVSRVNHCAAEGVDQIMSGGPASHQRRVTRWVDDGPPPLRRSSGEDYTTTGNPAQPEQLGDVEDGYELVAHSPTVPRCARQRLQAAAGSSSPASSYALVPLASSAASSTSTHYAVPFSGVDAEDLQYTSLVLNDEDSCAEQREPAVQCGSRERSSNTSLLDAASDAGVSSKVPHGPASKYGRPLAAPPHESPAVGGSDGVAPRKDSSGCGSGVAPTNEVNGGVRITRGGKQRSSGAYGFSGEPTAPLRITRGGKQRSSGAYGFSGGAGDGGGDVDA
jgi:hypothetical protein